MKSKVLSILKKITGSKIVEENLEIDLFENFLMDSMDFIEMLVEFEKRFNIYISPSEFERDELNTPSKIIKIVENKLCN